MLTTRYLDLYFSEISAAPPPPGLRLGALGRGLIIPLTPRPRPASSPNASKPVRDEGERGHEEDEDCGAVLGVAVDFARHADQPEQPRRLQQSYQGRGLQE